MKQLRENIACAGCSCVCDDLTMTLAENRIAAFTPSCDLAGKWFERADVSQVAAAYVKGQPSSLDAAFSQAVAILQQSRAPLVYGLNTNSTDGYRAAIELADWLRGSIDIAASHLHGPLLQAIQEVGQSTGTLGEVRHRSDLLIYWGVDPVVSHPRHMERYTLEPRGRFIPEGRAGRRLIVIDEQETATAQLADRFLQLKPDTHFEILWTLRALVNDVAVSQSEIAGVSITTLREIASAMKNCRHGAIFFGSGLVAGSGTIATLEALLLLVRELNAHTRFHARSMFGAGADSVLAWQTGFPHSVNFSRGYPRYGPGEYSATQLLERGEVDACLLASCAGVSFLSHAARMALAQMPVIAIGPPDFKAESEPTVRFTTGIPGIHLPGSASRMDEVPLPLRQLISAPWPGDAEVLQQLLVRLKECGKSASS